MKGLETGKTSIRQQVFTEIARLAYEGGDYADKLERLPFELIPGEISSYRDSIFLERAVIGERLRLAMGLPVQRLADYARVSDGIEAALSLGQKPLVFTHYPVVMDDKCVEPLMDVLRRYEIERVYFGHIHGDRSGRLKNFTVDGVRFSLISADSLYFCPLKLTTDGRSDLTGGNV